MNKVKLFSAAIILATALATPALAEGHGGGHGGGMAMGGGGGHSFGGGGGAPSAGAFSGGGMRTSSGNLGGGGFVHGPSGPNFAHQGVRDGGWRGERHEGWRGERRGRRGGPGFAIGLGYGGYDYPYGYDSFAYDDGGCYLIRRRVLTPFGWRIRRVQVCD